MEQGQGGRGQGGRGLDGRDGRYHVGKGQVSFSDSYAVKFIEILKSLAHYSAGVCHLRLGLQLETVNKQFIFSWLNFNTNSIPVVVSINNINVNKMNKTKF